MIAEPITPTNTSKSEVLNRLEVAIESLTGEKVESLREHSISEYRKIGELKRSKTLRFVSSFPMIGRGNVLRDRVISHAGVEKKLDEALR
jgi:hypothetical protein